MNRIMIRSPFDAALVAFQRFQHRTSLDVSISFTSQPEGPSPVASMDLTGEGVAIILLNFRAPMSDVVAALLSQLAQLLAGPNAEGRRLKRWQETLFKAYADVVAEHRGETKH